MGLAQPWSSLPLGSTGNGAVSLLRRDRVPPTGWLAAASRGSSAAGKGTAECGRDARAPGGFCPDGAVLGHWRPTSLKAKVHPLGNPRLPVCPAPPCRADHSMKRGDCRLAPSQTRVGFGGGGGGGGGGGTGGQSSLLISLLPIGSHHLSRLWMPGTNVIVPMVNSVFPTRSL